MSQVREGTKLRCKKDYYDTQFPRVLFFKNSYYEVEIVTEDGVFIKMLSGEPEFLSYFRKEIKSKDKFGTIRYYAQIWEFFYTVEEDRVMKIGRLINK